MNITLSTSESDSPVEMLKNMTRFQLILPVDSQNVPKKSDGSQNARRGSLDMPN